MADDLKPMLAKVLGSGGRKKFFFAYGSGKRKDGKGDGELAIGGTKPKKADIEGELAACKEVLEGACWTGKGPDDGSTVYFQGKGKKLAPALVAKMMLTAKRVTGRQYDFQVPSPEEEARADKLAEGDANEAPTEPGTPPSGQTEGGPENLEAAYQARVKALTDGLKKVIASGTAAGNEAKLRFSESQVLFRKKDFPQALALLDAVEDQIRQALAGAGGAKGSEPTTTETAKGDPTAEWKAKLAEWSPAIKAAITAKGPNAPAIAKLLAQATALSKPGGDMAQALAKLSECHALANGGATPQGDPAAEFKAKLAEWTPAIKAAMATKGPNAAAITKLLAQATALSKPGGDLAQALAKLNECHQLATADAPTPMDPAAEFKAKLAEWTPAIKTAMAAKGPNAAAIAKLLAQATALSKPGGDMAQALAKLNECHALVTSDIATPKTGTATPEIQKGIVAKRTFLLTRWKQIPKEIAPDLEALIKSIAVEHPNLTNLPELRVVIDKQLQALYDELQDEIDGAINSGDSTVLKGLRERVLKHEFVNHLMSNPFVSGSKFQTSILNALQEVEQRLAS